MDLIESGSNIDIFYAKTCATKKISTVAGYHVVLATPFLCCCSGLTSLSIIFQSYHDVVWLQHRELNAHLYSAASLNYHTLDT